MVIQDKMVRRKISYPHKSIEKYVKLHYNILPNSMTMPGADARENIDKLLLSAGWQIQDVSKINLGAGFGVAVREFHLNEGIAGWTIMSGRSLRQQRGVKA